MEAAFMAGVSRFLFVSSVCAYPQGELHDEDNLWEGMPKQNDRYAGIAKRVGEIQGETYLLEHQWDAVRVIRPANVFGPYDDFNPATAQVIPALISRALSGENPLVVWGDGSAVRDFVFSEDVADAALLALEKAPASVPINIGSGRGITIKDLADTVASLVPGNPTIEWDTTKPAGDPIRLLATERAQELLGYTPATSLADGIGKTIEWYLSNSDLANRRKGVVNAGE
jgi:GDP-L-fucose synthase